MEVRSGPQRWPLQGEIWIETAHDDGHRRLSGRRVQCAFMLLPLAAAESGVPRELESDHERAPLSEQKR